jgi:hypothetical protein
MRSGHTDRLRHAIDRGRTRDKVAHPDPAAAPLGTDDEAAGTAAHPAVADPHQEHPAPPPVGATPLTGASLVYAILVLALAVAMLAGVWMVGAGPR